MWYNIVFFKQIRILKCRMIFLVAITRNNSCLKHQTASTRGSYSVNTPTVEWTYPGSLYPNLHDYFRDTVLGFICNCIVSTKRNCIVG